MLQVKDIMTKNPITVLPETEIVIASKILLEKRINGVPVVDKAGKLLGIICQSDLIVQQKKLPIPSLFTFLDGFISLTSKKHLESEIQKIAAITVAQAMTVNPVTVSPATSVEDVATLMVEKKFHTIPVLENGILVGVVGKEDILKTIIPQIEKN